MLVKNIAKLEIFYNLLEKSGLDKEIVSLKDLVEDTISDLKEELYEIGLVSEKRGIS